jgi:hypothetical protein
MARCSGRTDVLFGPAVRAAPRQEHAPTSVMGGRGSRFKSALLRRRALVQTSDLEAASAQLPGGSSGSSRR